jgi:hypothetical protein
VRAPILLSSLLLLGGLVQGCSSPSPLACDDDPRGSCGAGRYCLVEGGGVSGCRPIPGNPAQCGREKWPGECTSGKPAGDAGGGDRAADGPAGGGDGAGGAGGAGDAGPGPGQEVGPLADGGGDLPGPAPGTDAPAADAAPVADAPPGAICVPDSKRCYGGPPAISQLCAGGQAWTNIETCGGLGCDQAAGTCNRCSPGGRRCSTTFSESCDGDGLGYSLAESCGSLGCNPGTGRCIKCTSDEHICSNRCVSNSAVATCGALCEPCPAVQGGTAVCTAGKCDGVCGAGLVKCLGDPLKCDVGQWGFESGTVEGWEVNTTYSGPGLYVGPASSRAHSGMRAIEAEYEYAIGFSPKAFELRKRLCPPNLNTDVVGRRATAWVYLAPARSDNGVEVPPGAACGLLVDGWTRLSLGSATPLRAREWVQLSGMLSAAAIESRGQPLSLGLYCNFDALTAGYLATVYIDDIGFE